MMLTDAKRCYLVHGSNAVITMVTKVHAFHDLLLTAVLYPSSCGSEITDPILESGDMTSGKIDQRTSALVCHSLTTHHFMFINCD